MGRKKENPRYNVLSCRVSDNINHTVASILAGRTVQEFLTAAIEEKLLREHWSANDPRFADLYKGLRHDRP